MTPRRRSPVFVLLCSCVLAILAAGVALGTTSPAGAARTPGVREGPRRVTFVNHLSETIWVAASPGNAPYTLSHTGWKLPAGKELTIVVPNHWNGRFWGRTGCHFNAAGRGGCQTGDCDHRLECQGYGAIPATLAEYDLDAWDHLDFYDVSMVDGSNLPMWINQLGGRSKDPISPTGCIPAGCTKAVVCPSVLQVKVHGAVVGCISACAHFGTDQYCCRGKWSSRAACNPKKWPVDYAAVFKRAEPYAYSYVYDDATSVFTCYGDCDYRITFGLTPLKPKAPVALAEDSAGAHLHWPRCSRPHPLSSLPSTKGAVMRHAHMSIEKAFVTWSEGMGRGAGAAQLGDFGACRRR